MALARYANECAKRSDRYGPRFSAANLAPQMIRWFNTGYLVRVKDHRGVTHEGRIGMANGMTPHFTLVGPVPVRLGPGHHVTHFKNGRSPWTEAMFR